MGTYQNDVYKPGQDPAGRTVISVTALEELLRKAAWYDNHPDIAGVPEDKFESGLRELINSYSKEQGSNTADFVLASYLTACLSTWDYHVRYRADATHIREMRDAGLNVEDPTGVERFQEVHIERQQLTENGPVHGGFIVTEFKGHENMGSPESDPKP